jgi:hypothetical protein
VPNLLKKAGTNMIRTELIKPAAIAKAPIGWNTPKNNKAVHDEESRSIAIQKIINLFPLLPAPAITQTARIVVARTATTNNGNPARITL